MSSEADLPEALTRFPDPGPAELDRLRAGLAMRADAAGVLDIAVATVDTPVGPLLLATTAAGLVRVAYAVEDHSTVLQALSDRISPRILEAPARLDDARRQLEEYFAGSRHDFELPLDWRLTTGFRGGVLRELARVGYGHTASYATVAGLVGHPRAVRAVASACATNPLPVVVACHRVVRADGGIGGYLGGVAAKQTLLALESAG